ncbi:hypothetical protein CXB51_010049 [Gossypium anomalum]|uniref:CRM domain-containing protein n=1 Tax=Gossypium anomalum TaxID=47600 RepID=A0A8J5Z250_9ROSI|nr:hypothetical protein CXB51_010049 [Gossypium anomalum]
MKGRNGMLRRFVCFVLGKNGVTRNMLDDIHNHWKRAEAARIKCLGVPTLDVDNEKSGGEIIYRHKNILILYRGRNYDPQNRPVIPLMLWQPYAPIYPKLVKNVADGLTFEETKEMRNRGLHSPALMKLTRNGVYVNVVARVREAFETEEVIRLDCTRVGASDCKRIGDLVPCVPILFKDEQIILWRGKRDQERNSDISDANEKSSGCLLIPLPGKAIVADENQCTSSSKQPYCPHLFALVHPSCCISDVKFSQLGKLKKLKILNFRGCYLERVPDVLRELNSLRLLYLSHGDGKWTIPPNLIQRLSKLEELYISDFSFSERAIQGAGEEATTASLLELASLSRLTTLMMKANSMCLPKDFVFPKLQRYKITINGCFDFWDMKCLIHTTKKQVPTIALFNLTELFMEEMISFEELCIGQNLKGFLRKLERFTAEGCATMDKMIFLSNLRCIWEGPTDLVSLQGLKSVSIGSYIKLPFVFSPVLAQGLLQLETLEIHVCPGLKHVIIDTTDSDSYTPCLPKLTTLKISSFDRLKCVFPISMAPDFPHLREIKISNCIQLKRIFSLTKEMDGNDIFLPQLQLLVFKNLRNLSTFCLPNCVILQLSLERLEVEECLLLAPFVIQDMMRGNGVSFHGRHKSMPMEYLIIGNCEQVFQVEGGFFVSSLEKLRLKDMQELQGITQSELNSSLIITNHRLDGKNFLQWSQSVLMVIRGRGKLGPYKPYLSPFQNCKRHVGWSQRKLLGSWKRLPKLDMYYEADWGEGLEHTKFMTHLNIKRLYEFLAGQNRELDEKDNRTALLSSTTENDVLDVRLTKTQLETFHKILGTSTAHGSLATQGNSTLFHTYTPCHDKSRIRIADGSYSPVAGVGEERKSGRMIGTAKVDDRLYVWNKDSTQGGLALSTSKEDTIMLWHHSDLWGASRVKNITGARWLITFIDDHTRVCEVYLLKEKSETPKRETFNEDETLNTLLIIPYDPTTTITNKPNNQGAMDYSRRNRSLETDTVVPIASPTDDCFETEVSPPSPSIYLPIAVRKGTITCTQHLISRFVSYGNLSKSYKAFVTNVDSVKTPKNIKEALESAEWRQATFAPVAKLNTIRVLLSLAANLDWHLTQLDVKNAFLNWELNKEVYIDFPPGFEESNGQVCKLKKSLYGLKQSPRGKCCILIVYVDNIILTGDYSSEIVRLKEFLGTKFELKDLENLKYFLGMEVARSQIGISISQRKYVLDLLSEVGLMGCKYPRFLWNLTLNWELMRMEKKSTGGDINDHQYMHAPREKHLEAAYRILRYLKGTPNKGLHFKKTANQNVKVYIDTDWAGSANDRRSTSGHCSYVWGNLVTWRRKKQFVVARSSAEAEYRALSHGLCEGVWIQ